jgi:hypothetical protein
MKIDWKNIVVPIIAGLIVASSSYVGFLISAIAKPTINIDIRLANENEATISIRNVGWSPAKNLKLTVEYPFNIIDQSIFSTENYTKSNSSKLLEMNIPRFAQGDGSFLRIRTGSQNTSAITEDDQYVVYGTYDQGSNMNSAYVIERPPPDVIDTLVQWWSPVSSYVGIIISVIGIITGVLTSIVQRSVRRRNLQNQRRSQREAAAVAERIARDVAGGENDRDRDRRIVIQQFMRELCRRDAEADVGEDNRIFRLSEIRLTVLRAFDLGYVRQLLTTYSMETDPDIQLIGEDQIRLTRGGRSRCATFGL